MFTRGYLSSEENSCVASGLTLNLGVQLRNRDGEVFKYQLSAGFQDPSCQSEPDRRKIAKPL